MEEVVFMLQVKRSERGLESRPPSSLVSPDALLHQENKENSSGVRQMLGRGGSVSYISLKSSPWCFCPSTGLSLTRHPEINQKTLLCPQSDVNTLYQPPSSPDTERGVRHHARKESTVLGIRVQHTMRWVWLLGAHTIVAPLQLPNASSHLLYAFLSLYPTDLHVVSKSSKPSPHNFPDFLFTQTRHEDGGE